MKSSSLIQKHTALKDNEKALIRDQRLGKVEGVAITTSVVPARRPRTRG